jgi:hypothetical protein
MYLSHPVRRIREDPDPDSTVALVIDPAPDDAASIARAVESRGGSVERRLRFGSLEVVVPEPAVADLCDRDDVARIETTDTLGLGL